MENDKLVRSRVFADWLKGRADDLASRAQKPVPGAPGCYTVDDGLSCAAAVMYDAYRMYQLQPAVDAVEVRHGRWIDENPDEPLAPRMKCSNCTCVSEPLVKWEHCPVCGARMDGEDGDV